MVNNNIILLNLNVAYLRMHTAIAIRRDAAEFVLMLFIKLE
jgi:hypothetical protein